MPLPQRRKDEDRTDFLSRCMSDPKMNEEYPDNSQRYAVCIQSAKGETADQVKDNYYDQVFGSTEFITNESEMYIPAESEYLDFGEKEEEYTIALQYGKPPKNDPRKTPAPKKDRKRGSDKNDPDSAKDDKGDITLSKETVDKLQTKIKEHNAKVAEKNSGSKATLSQLKAVYRRGAGAYSTSHHPKMSRDGWAMARVNAFLYLLRNGRPSNPNYKQDNDLLPKSHPRSTKAEYDEGSMQVAQIKKMHMQLMQLVEKIGDNGFEFEEWTKDKISKAEHYIEAIFDAVMFNYDEPDVSDDYSEANDDKKNVKLNKPFRTPKGPKKFSVYVKNDKGNIVKVNFGDPNMEIKRDDPERRKNFRSRHQCDTNPGPKWKARYWSCKFWESNKSVTDLT